MVRHRRADATLVPEVPAYRRMMPYLMRGRNESAVYFELDADVRGTRAALTRFNDRRDGPPATLLHAVTWSAVQTLTERPHLNRFVAGGRLYERDGIWISWSAKQQMADGAPIVVLKRRFDAAEPFAELVTAMAGAAAGARTGVRTHVDRELALVLRLPGPGLRALLALERAVDGAGLLPAAYIEPDPMFASMLIANLGSVGLGAAFHHLYEYGTISLFCTMGLAGENGRLRLRFTYDERVEDGYYAARALEVFRGYLEEASFS